jgi:hypothetical protein
MLPSAEHPGAQQQAQRSPTLTSDEHSDEVALNLEYGRLEAQLASMEASLEHERSEVLLELERLEELATPVHYIEPASPAPVRICPDNGKKPGALHGSRLVSQPDPKCIPPFRQGQRATSLSLPRTSWASNDNLRASAAACSRFHTRLNAWRPPPICIPPDQGDSSCRQEEDQQVQSTRGLDSVMNML